MAEFFRQGALDMQTSLTDTAAAAMQWGDCPVNRIAILAAVVLCLVFMMDFLRLLPQIWDCITRWKGNISLEHSLSQARMRNGLACVCALPFLLMADRYRLWDPGFLGSVPMNLSLACTCGALAAYMMIRRLFYAVTRRGRLSSEEYSALRHTIYNHFIIIVLVMMATAGTMNVAGASDAAVKTVLLILTGLCWLGSLLRCGQILSSRCSGFSTILYLCALEILPAGIMIFTSTR